MPFTYGHKCLPTEYVKLFTSKEVALRLNMNISTYSNIKHSPFVIMTFFSLLKCHVNTFLSLLIKNQNPPANSSRDINDIK